MNYNEIYGEKYIYDVERVFYFDSLFILNYFSKYKEEDNNRWLVSLKYINSFLNKCGFSLNDKLDFFETMSLSYSKEIYSNAKFVNKQLNEKYKYNRKQITEIIENDILQNHIWMKDMKNYLNQIVFFTRKVKFQKNEKTSPKIFLLLNSIIHMHVNRMFRTKQRINECVIYYLLFKYTKSKNMIEKNNTDEYTLPK